MSNLNFQQISDVGTTNPIVARLAVQTIDVIKLFPLSKNQEEDIIRILAMNVRERLVNCYKIQMKIKEETVKINEIKKEDIFHGNTTHIPSINELRYSCETFLYEAKSCLRDLLEIFRVFYDESFQGARWDLVVKWAREKFGKKR